MINTPVFYDEECQWIADKDGRPFAEGVIIRPGAVDRHNPGPTDSLLSIRAKDALRAYRKKWATKTHRQ